MFGALIESGAEHWRIYQQKNGAADIKLEGHWVPTAEIDGENAEVFARIVSEEAGEVVIPWTKAENCGKKRWQVLLKDVCAGGLYRIETCLKGPDMDMEHARRGDMVHHIGVGDLYVIAGQSNSAGYGRDSVYDAPELGVHLLRNSGLWDLASHPMNDPTGSIHMANIENINPGHSPYLLFAKRLKNKLGYPIGLLQCSKGGSALSEWLPDEDGELYHCMMEVIRSQGGAIKGILWYQGCTDAIIMQSDNYLGRFKGFVDILRRDLSDRELAFLTVQLNRHMDEKKVSDDMHWGAVREAQRQAAKVITNVYVVPANDCKLSDGIHNSAGSNLVIGERLAKKALSRIYKAARDYDAPDIQGAKRIDDKKIMLSFDHVTSRMICFAVPVKSLPFTVEDESGIVPIEAYKEQGCNILLELEREISGKAMVSGCFEANPSVFVPIDMGSQLPMLSFYRVEVGD